MATLRTPSKYAAYDIKAVNAFTREVVPGCVADSIEDLSSMMPISIDGNDYVLQHSDIKNSKRPDDFEVIVRGWRSDNGRWEEIPDPRIHREYLC